MNKFVPLFEINNNKKYKMEAIQNSAVYVKEVDGYPWRLYYLIVWKSYIEEINL